MKIIIAPDSFKDSLSSIEICRIIENSIHAEAPDIVTESIPVADGGEGFVETLVAATNGRIVTSRVTGPLGDKVDAEWGMLGDEETAVVGMAAASGLMLVPQKKRNPLETTTFGTGELIRRAVDSGCKRILVGIGGSATTDMGTGMAQALGVRFLDAAGNEITEPMNGRLMGKVERIDLSGIRIDTNAVNISAACDVSNPLLGEQGAVRVYSPQKGADAAMCDELEANMTHLAGIVAKTIRDVRNIPGAGAAGGIGAGLTAFLNAELVPGIQLVLDVCRFQERIRDANWIITGEGRIDDQIIFGKTIAGICRIANAIQVPVIAVAGAVTASRDVLNKTGLYACFPIVNRPMNLASAIRETKSLLDRTIRDIIKLIKYDEY